MIPVATTTVKVWRKGSAVEDPWDEPVSAFAVLDDGVRAVISVSSGRTVGPGDSESVEFALLADPCDLQYLDEVEDESTGRRYAVEWAMASPGVAGQLASVRAGLSTREGA